MEPNEPSELISEIEEERHEEHARDRFRSRAAVWVAILAALMAVRGLGGENAKDEMIAKNIQTSDAWAFYQAKNVRQTQYKIAADQLQQDIAGGGLVGEQRALAEKRLQKYQQTIARYDNEATGPNDPEGGGKAQLRERAKTLAEARETFEHKNHNFDLAEMVYQLGLVLASVSILTGAKKLLLGSVILGVLGALLTLNGFFWIVQAIG